MMSGSLGLQRAGHAILFLLAFIHLVLPFTVANSHPELRIKVAAVILGIAFLSLAVAGFRYRYPATVLGLVLFVGVCITAALGGSSPLAEGWPIKLLFLASLAGSALALRRAVSASPTE